MIVRLVLHGLGAAALCWGTPALACRGPMLESHVFLPRLPASLPGEPLVLRVSPIAGERAQGDTQRVAVDAVVTGSWPHDTAWVDFGEVDSCSRAWLPEEGAFVVGQASAAPRWLVARRFRMSELMPELQPEPTHDR